MNSEKCRNTALRYVAMRMRTEGQVADYLRRKEFEEADIADAIGFLREYRYVDDHDGKGQSIVRRQENAEKP